MIPDCYKCKHQRRSQWSGSHSSCAHPLASLFDENHALNIQAKPHGIAMGWFTWPADFDPVWLVNCDGFAEKEVPNGQT